MAFGDYNKSSLDFATFNEVAPLCHFIKCGTILPLHKMWHGLG
jgi:hypothetical protein